MHPTSNVPITFSFMIPPLCCYGACITVAARDQKPSAFHSTIMDTSVCLRLLLTLHLYRCARLHTNFFCPKKSAIKGALGTRLWNLRALPTGHCTRALYLTLPADGGCYIRKMSKVQHYRGTPYTKGKIISTSCLNKGKILSTSCLNLNRSVRF